MAALTLYSNTKRPSTRHYVPMVVHLATAMDWQLRAVALYSLTMRRQPCVFIIHFILWDAILSLDIVVAKIGRVEKVANIENDMVLLKYLLAPNALPKIYDHGVNLMET